jgi:transposase
MQPLTEDRKKTIELYLRQGFSYHKIMNIVKISSSTVHKVRLKLSLPARNDKGGRSKALTKREQQHLVRAITADGLENAAQAQQFLEQNLGKSISVDIVRRALKDAGLVSLSS